MTRYVGLIGHPVGHSVSPAMHKAAFDRLGLDMRYELWDTEESNLPDRVQGLKDPSRLGANVTVPYKESVVPLIDSLDDLAGRIGAVNTLINYEGRLVGHNTDAGGFLRALQQDGGFDPARRRAVLIGAGGVARAVAFALASQRARSVVLTDVVPERAQKLAEDLLRAPSAASNLEVRTMSVDSGEFAGVLWNSDLLVNCTPIGMKHSPTEGQSPIEKALIPKGMLVYDVIYNPAETRLLADAARVGARVLGGLSMLVYQGALAFELWTGRDAPVDVMMEAAGASLQS